MTAFPLVLPAPAKLNLFLHVTGRRPDGYHLLQTVFQLLDYGDELAFRPRQDGGLVLEGGVPGVPADDNLVLRAARLLQAIAGPSYGADIHLRKRLPAGGGLGGGSSDAATTLLALDALWGLQLGLDRLAGIGLDLGADVPVFVRGRSSWAEGVGEVLVPLALPENWYVVLTPAVAVSTAAVFGSEELTRSTPPITIAAFSQGGQGIALRNDCQPVVEKHYPAVKSALEWLSRHAPCRMTGTGASVFAAFGSEAQAAAVLAQKPVWLDGFVAKGVNESPVHRWLQTDYWGIAKR